MQSRPSVFRRSLLTAAAGCFGGSLLLRAGAFEAATADSTRPVWQQRWGDGTQRKFTPAQPAPSDLEESWSATPQKRHGTVTVECVDDERVYARDYDRLLAYDREDGTRAWVYAANEGSFSRPTLVGDTLLVHENGTVHAVDAGDGSARWTGSFNAPYQSAANPTARNGLVYLPVAESYTAVQPATGLRRESVSAAQLGTLVAATDDQLFWWQDGTLQATNLAGTIQWRRTFARSFPPSSRTIAIVGETVVLRRFSTTTGATLTALDVTSGEPVWNHTRGVPDNVTLAAGPETVYVGSGTMLRARDRANGDLRWSLSAGTVRPAPVVTPTTVYVPLDEGIAPVDPDSGERRTTPLLADRTTTSLAAGDGCVYASTRNGIYALEEP